MPLITRTIDNTGSPLVDVNGSVLASTLIRFTLVNSRSYAAGTFDATTGEPVAPGPYLATTDDDGLFSVDLWPTSRGLEERFYLVEIAPDSDSVEFQAFKAPLADGMVPLPFLAFRLGGDAVPAWEMDAFTAHANDMAIHIGHSHSNKAALDNVSGINTGDQDLSGYSLTTHNHSLNNLTEKSYNSLTDKPSIPSISGLLDETAHYALDHTGLTGVLALGTTGTTACAGNDSRLSDARTPTVHNNTAHSETYVVSGGALGTPSSGTVTNLTGTASININGTVGATTPAAGAFTTVNVTGGITSNTVGDNITLQNGGGVALGKVFNNVGYLDYQASGNVNGLYLSTNTTSNIYLRPNNTTIATVSPTGLAVTGAVSVTATNLVGTAISARYNAVNNKTGFIVDNGNGDVGIGLNCNAAASSSAQTYDISNYAAKMRLVSGGFQFYGAPLGTAGDNISWSPLATLSSTGLAVTGTIGATSGNANIMSLAGASGTTAWVYAGSNLVGFGDTATLGGTHYYIDSSAKTASVQVDNAIKATISSTGLAVTGQYSLTALNTAPASASATGTTGEIRVTADHIYVCTATNTWKRTALATW